MDPFRAFHTKIQVLANLNENIVNSHFPEELDHCVVRRKKPKTSAKADNSWSISSDSNDNAVPGPATISRGPPRLRPPLPQEVTELILRDLSKVELLPVLRSNKALYSVAVRVLYRELAESSPSRLISLLRALLPQTHVHPHVRKLDLNIASLECPTANLYRTLHALLRRTTGLASLSLDLPKAHSPVWIFEGCSFKLRQFSTSMHCSPALARFLDTQDRIVQLTLRGFQNDTMRSLPYLYMDITHTLTGIPGSGAIEILKKQEAGLEPFVLSPGALPRLAVFNAIHAGPAVVGEVVKGRPVTTVSIPLFSTNARRSLDALEGSAVPLKRLSIISFDPDAPNYIFEQVATRFPELEALHIVVLLAEFTNELLLAACQHLRHFKRLKYITCVATSSEESSVAEEQEIAEKWHEECPTLRTIILPRGRVWFQKPARISSDRNWECLED
ncbi:hypothetical protein DFP72DRAFT_275018 [Ephemerocybe angulata]|uniref:Uncharacterized protein n=1 Tax=Ephemerocybe angulata TaxID=980116 RepID=A0A8H6I3J4_9AGAR|nr:hypothetical protein DFP72DRAFT_275018 [Tulosesus angulatus]